ncbi:ABC transporter permease [Candidatus Saccharibacteria bacterium]|nr:ABC transporter permease [Candidatus Saccharibacteria bacterium]
MITFWRIFKSGFRNTFRNAWLSTAATAIMVITLLIMTFFVFSTMFVRTQLAEVRNKIDLTIFLSDEAPADNIKDLQSRMLTVDNVQSVTFVSKADALNQLASSSSEGGQLAKSATEIGNPLPASFQVKLKSLDQIGDTNGKIRALDDNKVISDTSYDNRDNNRKGVIENVIKISNAVSRIGLVLSMIFLVVALLVIFNTIRMAIFTRREEIEIMKLVGATKWFIRGPFLVEGSMYGAFGAFIALLLLVPFARSVGPFLADRLNAGSTLQYFQSHIILVVLGLVLTGVVIGAVSSLLAIARHLKL